MFSFMNRSTGSRGGGRGGGGSRGGGRDGGGNRGQGVGRGRGRKRWIGDYYTGRMYGWFRCSECKKRWESSYVYMNEEEEVHV